MRLAPGTRLGTYEVTAQIGEGGMGQVFRARDTKLNRDVALKVLPESFATDPDRLARFQREAQVLASLNHPNIAHIHGLEDSGGVRALVMELVEGEDLAQRLTRGAIPIDEALPIAKQIAEALEAAHEQGIIHRDLKPANVKVRADGTAKVLDFGLAKALDPLASSPDMSQSPTITTPAMTHAGMILGTAAYMSPEQARGKPVDKRTDIWAFGCVLYEMLTGKRAFQGEDVTDTLAAVLRAEPAWLRLPHNLPEAVQTLLRRCLTKDPSHRLRDIGDARFDLDAADPARSHESTPRRRASSRTWTVSALAAVLGLAFGLGLTWRMERPAPSPGGAVISFDVTTPVSADPVGFALSPDGRQLVFLADSKLWLRRLDQNVAQPLNGTDGATTPFWSPDSRSVGFLAGGKLKRIDVASGSVLALSIIPVDLRGASWNHENVILYGTNIANGVIQRLSAMGGVPTDATRGVGQGGQRFPQFLPDGRHFIFTVTQGPLTRSTYLGTLDALEVQDLKLVSDSSVAIAAPNHLLFLRKGTLMMATLDLARGAITGDPMPIVQPVGVSPQTTEGAFTVSETGVLAYRRSGSVLRQLTWVDRHGQVLGQVGPVDDTGLFFVQVSPDDQRIAVQRTIDGNADLWITDASRAGFTRLTFANSVESAPVWSRDGKRLTYRSNRTDVWDLFEKSVDSAEDEQLLLASNESKTPDDWSPDDQVLLFERAVIGMAAELRAWRRGSGETPVLVTKAGSKAQFSPNGRWIAYQSGESGRPEIYIQPFPPSGGKSVVSVAGGDQPRWAAGGNEIYYVAPDGWMMGVSIANTGGRALKIGIPEKLFDARLFSLGGPNQQYAVTRDGRFLMNRMADQTIPITVVVNWMSTLKK